MNRRHIILVGLPGAGKSTAGPLAARRLGAEFSDLDDLIAGQAGKSVARIFAEEGEAAFRALETRCGAAAFALGPRVIALGGGFLEAPQNARNARAAGVVIYLRTSPETAAGRLQGAQDRPLLAGGERLPRLQELLGRREASYVESGLAVTTDLLDPAAVAEAISELARERGGW